MRTIGLLGGLSFESSAAYYRLINEGVRSRLGGLHSAEILMYSVDFQTIVDMQKADHWEQAGQRLAMAACNLEHSGAQCMLICSNTMHRVADQVQHAVDVPLLNIIDETARRLAAYACKRPLLLATRYTMEHGFYTERMREHGVEVLLPAEADRAQAHRIIFEELCAGKVEETSRVELRGVIERARVQGADAIILGCTELGMILDPETLPMRVLDSTVIHCEAAVEFALQS